MQKSDFWRQNLAAGPLPSAEVEFTQTYSTASATVAAATATTTAALTSANLTGTLTGTVDGTLEDVADIALSTSGGNTYTDAAVNTAVNAAILATNLQLKELLSNVNKLFADITAQKAQQDKFVADVLNNKQVINKIIDTLQGGGIAS